MTVFDKVQVLDKGYVELVDAWGSDQAVVEAARMSTGKPFEGWGPFPTGKPCPECEGTGKVEEITFGGTNQPPCPDCNGTAWETRPGAEKLLAYLWKHKHSTPFEVCGLTFEVQLPIFVAREWQRHRVPFGYSEASARYAPLPDLNFVPTIDRIMEGGGHLTRQAAGVAQLATKPELDSWLWNVETFYKMAEDIYQKGLLLGVPKELARVVVPVGRYTKMRVTGNLRGWLAFLELRSHPTAQREIREYAGVVRAFVAEQFPRVAKVALGIGS